MKICLLRTAAMLFLCILIQGCVKVVTEVEIITPTVLGPSDSLDTTMVYGTVFNDVSLDPVNGAYVEIGQNNESDQQYYGSTSCYEITSYVTGSDGQFQLEFSNLGNYENFYIAISCYGYLNTYKKIKISVGKKQQIEVKLTPQ